MKFSLDGGINFVGNAFRVRRPILNQSLLAWYRFEDGNARDYASDAEFPDIQWGDPTSYDGTLNGPTYDSTQGTRDIMSNTSGTFGFNGSTDEITVNTGLLSGETQISYGAWVNADNYPSNDMGIMGKWTGSSTLAWTVWYDIGNNVFGSAVNDGSSTISVQTGPSPSAGEWYHVFVTYDSTGEMKLFVNGNEVGSTAAGGSINTHSDWEIGSDDETHNYWDGRIDDVRVYDGVLSPSDISSIYNRTKLTLLQQEIQRVKRDGGTIEDGIETNLVEPILRKLDNAGQLSNLEFLGAAGARKVISGSVVKMYDWSGNQNDVDQATSSQRPTDTTSSEYGGRVVSSFDGSDDILTNTSIIDFTGDQTYTTIWAAHSNNGSGTEVDNSVFNVGDDNSGAGDRRNLIWAYENGQSDEAARLIGGNLIYPDSADAGTVASIRYSGGGTVSDWTHTLNDSTRSPTSSSTDVHNFQGSEDLTIGNAREGMDIPLDGPLQSVIILNDDIGSTLEKEIRDIVNSYCGNIY